MAKTAQGSKKIADLYEKNQKQENNLCSFWQKDTKAEFFFNSLYDRVQSSYFWFKKAK